MPGRSGPTYSLTTIKALVDAGSFHITQAALTGAFRLSFDRSDIEACVLQLTDQDFYKTMPATQCPGLMQDVYKPRYLGVSLYVKLQLSSGGARSVVISFKEE